VKWWQRLRNHERLERELDAELRYHFDREVADNLRMGMSEEEARRRARLDLGGDDPLKESCRVLGTAGFRRVSVLVRAALVVTLVTTLLLIPAMAFRVATLWLQGSIDGTLLPPMWFAGLHELMSGHVWAQLPRPDLPPSFAASERAFELLYQSRRSSLRQLGINGGGIFLLVLITSAVAYRWTNRRLPDPDVLRTAERGYLRVLDAMALRVIARRPLVRAGFVFTMRVLARSVQNRLSIGIPLAIAIAVSMVSLPAAGMTSVLDFSSAPVAVLAVQLLFVTALTIGFRHSIRVPADLRARWMFHLIRPAAQDVYLRGVKRAAVVKLVLPALLVLLPFHILALGRPVALVHFAFGLLSALVLREASLLEYRRLPFAANYVPEARITTYLGIYVFICLMSVYAVAWVEHLALRCAAQAAPLPSSSSLSRALRPSGPSTRGSGEILTKSSSTSSSTRLPCLVSRNRTGGRVALLRVDRSILVRKM
jgi:hypothetical protein